MIMGIAHIQLAVPDIKAAESFLLLNGYKKLFSQQDVFKGCASQKMFRDPHKDIHLFKHINGGLAIELIQRAVTSNTVPTPSYLPVLNCTNDIYVDCDRRILNGSNYQMNLKTAKPFDAIVASSHIYDPQRPLVDTVICACRHRKESRALWTTIFGFKRADAPVKTSDDHDVIALHSSRFESPITLILTDIAGAIRTSTYIDDYSFPLIALCITNGKQLRDRLITMDNIQTTEYFNLTINENKLKIFFLYGPSGEIIEFVERCE